MSTKSWVYSDVNVYEKLGYSAGFLPFSMFLIHVPADCPHHSISSPSCAPPWTALTLLLPCEIYRQVSPLFLISHRPASPLAPLRITFR
mmetsp:Transcript_21596/g.59262  ORF Transcript_21596/g.59262 Transcript_21596/m.59262 type:complete len:89 (-) Transcript_21596:262-528(-)